MAGVLGKAGLQFVSRGAARFKLVWLLQEQMATKESSRSDSIGGGKAVAQILLKSHSSDGAKD